MCVCVYFTLVAITLFKLSNIRIINTKYTFLFYSSIITNTLLIRLNFMYNLIDLRFVFKINVQCVLFYAKELNSFYT